MSKTFGNGRYQVIDKLGAGGMAIVYKAQDTVLNRIVTVKVLREQFASDEDFTQRFRREAQAVASLSHTNIVSIYDVGKEEDQEYIVMEFVDGRNLKEYIKEHAPLPLDKSIDIAKQICDALDHAHKHQIIHRDIKPHNILITEDGRVKVTDFGIARAASAATVTHTGTIVGSVHYFSPEQARGEVTNEQSDLYSLGIILYEMVTGSLPYDGESPISIALKHMNEEPKPPSQINPAVAKNLEHVILRAIAKYPSERYANAQEFKQDLIRVAQGLGTAPFKPGHRTGDNELTQVMSPVADKVKDKSTAAKPKRRIRPIAVVALIILILLGIGGSAYAWFNNYVHVPQTAMPDLRHLTISEATAKLQLSKLQLSAANVTYESSDTEPEGHIISQYPSPGTVIKITRPDISVVVSQGPKTATFPDVTTTQTNKDQALETIQSAGFTKQPKIDYVNSDTVPANIVISQNPAPNTDYPVNGDISLQVSKGPANQSISMPDVIGLSKDAAVQQLSQQRITVTTTAQTSTLYPEGYVIDSSPKPNADVMQGSNVTLVVSQGPGPVSKLILAKDTTSILQSLNIPNDGKQHQVVIKLHDYRGWIQVDQFTYQPNVPYTKDIQYFPTATLQIWVDGQDAYNNDFS